MPHNTEPFDPLKYVSSEDFTSIMQGQLDGIIQSYNGKLDVFIELIQNGMDAIELRWKNWDGTTPPENAKPEEIPRLDIHIDVDEKMVSVTDNGVGINQEKIKRYFTPFYSVKKKGESRGHKGVGATFLTYGHPYFEIFTRYYKDIDHHEYRSVEKGDSEINLSNPPEWIFKDGQPSHISEKHIGTVVSVKVDESTLTKTLKPKNSNREPLAMWEKLLRTFTAIGYIDLNMKEKPKWVEHLEVNLKYKHGNEHNKTIKPQFQYPDEGVRKKKNFDSFETDSSERRNLELVFIKWTNENLKTHLRSHLDELIDSEEDSNEETNNELVSLYDKYEPSIYASIAYKNTFYREKFFKEINKEGSTQMPYGIRLGGNSGSGVLIATAEMPAAPLQDHIHQKWAPQFKARLFILVHIKNYIPDLGRKIGISEEIKPLITDLEDQIYQRLTTKKVQDRLIKDREESTHNISDFDDAKQSLQEDADIYLATYDDANESFISENFTFKKPPQSEVELISIFSCMINSQKLRGYKFIRFPPSDMFDGLFEFTALDNDIHDSNSDDLGGISRMKLTRNRYQRTKRWLEFKNDLTDLLTDFGRPDGDGQSKYFKLLDLIVCWNIETGSNNNFEVEAYNNENWTDRSYHKATHKLIEIESRHSVDVISLRTLLTS